MVKPLVDWLERRLNLTEMFSFLTSFGLFPAELDTARPVREAVREALARPLPSYARWPRVLGILSVLLFVFLGVTGVMLALYYHPTPAEAHTSVTTIVRDVTFGWFVHQVHWWAAQAFLLILLIRLWRFFFQGLHRTPREVLWVAAGLTFLTATHADLTGRLLGWDAGGYWTTIRALEILYALPLLGPLFAFLSGGASVDSMVLSRFYFMHIVILPGMLLALFYLTSSTVRRVGLSGPAETGASGPAAYRIYLCNVLILAVLILGVLVTLATLVPATFEAAADPYSTPPGARPPWYLLASHGFLEAFPSMVPRWARGLLLEAILLICLLLPFLDRPGGGGRERSRLVLAGGVLMLVCWILFSWYGYSIEVGR